MLRKTRLPFFETLHRHSCEARNQTHQKHQKHPSKHRIDSFYVQSHRIRQKDCHSLTDTDQNVSFAVIMAQLWDDQT